MSQTEKNLYDAFVGEAKAHLRLLGFAERAEQEDYPQMAKLFRAIADAGSGVDQILVILAELIGVTYAEAFLDRPLALKAKLDKKFTGEGKMDKSSINKGKIK